jgi:hypothetical protein
MKQLLLAYVLLAMAGAAGAQPYVPTPNVGYPSVTPGTVVPGPSSGFAAPGYNWRGDRVDTDWRNNTFREDRFDNDWRNRNWQTRRELQDWHQRPDFSKARNPENPFDQGYVECGKGSVGSSSPCASYTRPSPTEKIETAGQGEQPSQKEKLSAAPRGVENCGHGSVWRRCQ